MREFLTRRREHGVTLIELMIVVAIVAILASVAYPSYDEHVRTTRRADAQTALLELAQFMERYYTTNGTYIGADDDLPFDEAPKDGATKYYDLQFEADPTATSYVLEASPKNAMAADRCGSLFLWHTGRKSQGNDPNNAIDTTCWRG